MNNVSAENFFGKDIEEWFGNYMNKNDLKLSIYTNKGETSEIRTVVTDRDLIYEAMDMLKSIKIGDVIADFSDRLESTAYLFGSDDDECCFTFSDGMLLYRGRLYSADGYDRLNNIFS